MIGLSLGRDPDQAVVDHIGVLIFANNKVAIRGNAQVVAEVELLFALAFKEELKAIWRTAATRYKAEDLAEFLGTAAGGAKIKLTIAHMQTLAACDHGCTLSSCSGS